MVAPGYLENPEVRRWLNGVEPAWTMLEFDSLNALRHEPSGTNRTIQLEPDLADAEISGSAVTTNALLLLQRAAEAGGLKLTATGNLSRAVVEGRGREGLESALSCRCSRRCEAASVAPYLPFAIAVGIGSLGGNASLPIYPAPKCACFEIGRSLPEARTPDAAPISALMLVGRKVEGYHRRPGCRFSEPSINART